MNSHQESYCLIKTKKMKLAISIVASLCLAGSIFLIYNAQQLDREKKAMIATQQKNQSTLQKAEHEANEARKQDSRSSQKALDVNSLICLELLRGSLKDPDSIRVKENTPFYHVDDENMLSVSITYSATNAYGGRITSVFLCGFKRNADSEFKLYVSSLGEH